MLVPRNNWCPKIAILDIFSRTLPQHGSNYFLKCSQLNNYASHARGTKSALSTLLAFGNCFFFLFAPITRVIIDILSPLLIYLNESKVTKIINIQVLCFMQKFYTISAIFSRIFHFIPEILNMNISHRKTPGFPVK